jgi:acyl transferase domain-containing protein
MPSRTRAHTPAHEAALSAAIDALVEAIRPILAGQPSPAIGAALGELVAMFIAGHFSGDRADTDNFRESMISAHVNLVRALVPVCEAVILAAKRKESH